MYRRIAAAISALLTFAAVLAVVPLISSEPTEAHTKAVRRCSYDPFAGRQCWNERVAHVHPPNHYSPPPDTSPRTTTTTTLPTTTTAKPKPKTPECAPGEHLNWGTTCHAHSFSPPSCGTGTFSPGGHHTPVPPPACPKKPTKPDDDDDDDGDDDDGDDTSGGDDGDDDTSSGDDGAESEDDDDTETEAGNLIGIAYTVKACTPYQAPTERYARHKHPLGHSSAPDTDCHRADNSHCPAGHTEQGGHGSQNCRDDSAYANGELRRIAGLVRSGTAAAARAAQAAFNKLMTDIGEVGIRNAEANVHLGKEIEELWDSAPESVQNAAKGAGCAFLAAIAVKSIAASAGATAPAWVTWASTSTAGGYCSGVLRDAIDWVTGNLDNEGGSTPDTTPEQTPRESGTAAPDTEPDAAPTQTPKEAWDDAFLKYRRGEIDKNEPRKAKIRHQCSLGMTSPLCQ